MMCQCSVRDPEEHEEGCPLHGYFIIARAASTRLTKLAPGAFHMSTPGGDDERMRQRFGMSEAEVRARIAIEDETRRRR